MPFHDAAVRLEQWAPVSGLLTAVLVTLSGVLLADGPGEPPVADASVTEYYADRTHRIVEAIGYFVALAACVAAALYLVTMLRASRRTGGGRYGLDLARATGSVAIAIAAIAATVSVVPAATVTKFGLQALDPSTARELNFLAELLFEGSLLFAGVAIAGLTAADWRTDLMPRWALLGAVVVAVASIAAFTFIVPVFALLAWLVVTSAILLRRADMAEAGRR